MDEFTQGYIECAFWADSDEIGRATMAHLAPEALASMVQACADFQSENAELLARYYRKYSPAHAGHDLWLTRNRHGAGFWDRYIPGDDSLGESLTEAAHRESECSLYLGDDGRVYMYGG